MSNRCVLPTVTQLAQFSKNTFNNKIITSPTYKIKLKDIDSNLIVALQACHYPEIYFFYLEIKLRNNLEAAMQLYLSTKSSDSSMNKSTEVRLGDRRAMQVASSRSI